LDSSCVHHQEFFHCTYTQQWYMSYMFADSLRAGSRRNSVPARKLSANLYDTPLLYVQWKTCDDGRRNCPKHVEFYSKNKFEKLVHFIVGFIIRIRTIYYWLWSSHLNLIYELRRTMQCRMFVVRTTMKIVRNLHTDCNTVEISVVNTRKKFRATSVC